MKPFFKPSNFSNPFSRLASRRQLLVFAGALLIPAVAYDLYIYSVNKKLNIRPNPSFIVQRYIDLRYFFASPPIMSDINKYWKEISSLDRQTIPRLDLAINYKNLTNLECQRRERLRKNHCIDYQFKYSKGTLSHDENLFRVKLRTKGDRLLHYQDPSNYSIKIDIKGEKRLWGMEEFSVQDPIIRNYTYEAFASKALRNEGIVTPRHFYAKLYINGVDKGLKHFEETIARELVESNERRYGPTYSLDEAVADHKTFELQDYKFWSQANPSLAQRGLDLLNNFDTNPQALRERIIIEKWAKYFAFVDVFNLYHGAVRKSVKYYLNPIYGKFEPIFFDGHNDVRFDDFILLDFVLKEKPNCQWICFEKPFFEVFFGNELNPNKEFIRLYLNYLGLYSSTEYVESFISSIDEYDYIRGELYRSLAQADSLEHRSFLPHLLSVNKIKTRAEKISSYLSSNSTKIYEKLGLAEASESNHSAEPVFLSGKKFITSDTQFENQKIVFQGDTEFILSSDTTLSFINTSIQTAENVKIKFTGIKNSMVVFQSVEGDVSYLATNNLGVNSSDYRILYGGLNFIDSKVSIRNLIVNRSLSEDGVNFIDSDARLGRVEFHNILSDALDADYSKLNIEQMSCFDVGNDCLDISFSNVNSKLLEAQNVKDKALSAGEKSRINLEQLIVENSEMAIVAKDLSQVIVNQWRVANVRVPIALFVKKPEFGSPSLLIHQQTPDTWLSQSLISADSSLTISNQVVQGQYSSANVLDKLYGNEFGVKTVR